MIPLYITTSRKPTVLTRRLARSMAHLLGAVVENRGKRDFEALQQRAAYFGCTRLAFIYESHGNPSRAAFFDLFSNKWLEPEIAIKNYKLTADKFRRPSSMKGIPLDKLGERTLELFGLEPTDEPAECELRASGSRLEFVFHNQTVLDVSVYIKL